MVDREVYERLVKELRSTLTFLKERQRYSEKEYLGNEELQAAIERKLEVAIQLCIDLASHIISERNLRYPDTYRQVFLTLGTQGILSVDLSEKLAKMAGFRNVLVHDYVRVEARRVYAALQGSLRDIEDYLKEIMDTLKL